MPTMPKSNSIALFYGSSTCYTEFVAEKIAARLGEDNIDVFNVESEPLATAETYQYLILGIPTWDYGELQEDWENVWPDLDTLNLKGKYVALFGVGDQIGYPDWFLDAMGYLYHRVINCGATVVGFWPTEGYEFNESKALNEEATHFTGLAIDEENEFSLTDERIDRWCQQIMQEFGLNES